MTVGAPNPGEQFAISVSGPDNDLDAIEAKLRGFMDKSV